jgi:hypothetical protein
MLRVALVALCLMVIRMNRDTLYFSAIFDLDAGPASITLPDSSKRFLLMQIIDETTTPQRWSTAKAAPR